MRPLSYLFDKVRDMDISDPACIDIVFDYYDELIAESDNYLLELVDKMQHAVISWEIPWYQDSKNLYFFGVPSEDLKKYNTTYLNGILSLDEHEHVKKRWRKLVKRFDIPDNIQCFVRWKRRSPEIDNASMLKIRHFVVAYLARGLQRTLPQVYRHLLTNFSRINRGQNYTPDEKKIVDICLYHNPKQAVILLSEVLSRDVKAIYNKYHEKLQGKVEKKRIKWNLTLATKFIHLLMKHTGESLEGLKNKRIGIELWRKLEDDFETQAEYLCRFWYTSLHCQIFCKCDITLRRIRRRVFKVLRKKPYRIWTDIKWKDVVAELPDGLTYQFIYWVTIRIFRIEKLHKNASLKDIIKVGLEKCKNKIHGNKRLKTMRLNKDGNLEVIRYDNKC